MIKRHWRGALLVDGLILGSWLAAVTLAVLHERGQLWGASTSLPRLHATMETKEQWFGLYYQGRKVGFSQLIINPQEERGIPGVALTDRGRVSFTLLGQPQQLDITAWAFVDADWRLQTFKAAVRSDTYRVEWTGQRRGDELVVTVATPAHTVTKRLRDLGGETFVNGLSSWTAFRRLQLGQSGKMWILNPLALTPDVVYFHVRERETVDGQEALVVESDMAGLTSTSWVTPEGEVLRERSPLGWELRREPQTQGLTRLMTLDPGLDLLSATSVTIDAPLEATERIARVVLRIDGMACDAITVRRPWQTPLPQPGTASGEAGAPQGPSCLMQLDRPAVDSARPPVPAALQRYRQPSVFVQSDDPRIRAKAREIVEALTDPWDQAAALNAWVYRTVTKRLTVGLPSAVDVLTTLVGDCHEHTVLFTALARSLGLPTRMIAGLVSWQGGLYYHAWPEVWIGQWVPTDPTLGQPVADAAHLGLVEAENEQLVALGQFVGKLRAHVVEVQREE